MENKIYKNGIEERVGEGDKLNYLLILNPKEERINNLPLNSDGFIFLNKFESTENNISIKGGFICMKTIPGCSLGGNNLLLIKCVSNVRMTLDSDLAISDIILSLEFKGTFLISKPFFFNNSVNFIGIFSSERSLGLLEENIFFFLNKFRSIVQDRQDSFFTNVRKIIFSYCINADSSSQQFQNLPDHNSCSFKDRLSPTNFTISHNISINLYLHKINSNQDYLNLSEITRIINKIIGTFMLHIGQINYNLEIE